MREASNEDEEQGNQAEISNSTRKIALRTPLVTNKKTEEDELLLDDESLSFRKIFWLVFKILSSISIPMAISYTFSISIFIISLLRKYQSETDDENSATTLIITMISFFIMLGVSPLFAMNTFSSNKIGELNKATEDQESASALESIHNHIFEISITGLFIGGIMAIPAFLPLYYAEEVLTTKLIFQQDNQVAKIAQGFLRPYSPTAFAMMLRIAAEQMMFSFRKEKAAMLIGIINLFLLGTPLAAFLGFGSVSFPKDGSAGMAIAFTVESFLTALAYTVYIRLHKDLRQYQFFNVFKIKQGFFKRQADLLKMAAFNFFSNFIEMATPFIMGIMAGRLASSSTQSVMTAVTPIFFFSSVLILSLGATCNQVVSKKLGAQQYLRASRLGKHGLLTSIIYTIPLPMFFAIYPNPLSSDPAIQSTLKYFAPVISAGIGFDNIRNNLLQQLRALLLKDAKRPIAISILSLLIGMITAGVLSQKTDSGIYGVAIGYLVGNVLAVILLSMLWSKEIQPEKMRATATLEKLPILFASKKKPTSFTHVSDRIESFNTSKTLNPSPSKYLSLSSDAR